MKKCYLFLTFFFISLLYSNNSYATIINARANGNWTATATWIGGVIPGPTDDAVINGYVVTVNTNVTVRKISITNASNANAKLLVTGTDTLTVLEDILVTAENKDKDVELHVNSTVKLIVKGNVNFIRSADNTFIKLLRFHLYGGSKTYIEGNFNFDYKSAGGLENKVDILTSGSATLDVTGKTTLITSGGTDLDFRLKGTSKAILHDSLFLLLYGGAETAITADEASHFQLEGHAYLLNSGGSNHTKLKAGDFGGKMTINGDVIMETTASVLDLDVKLEAKGATSELNVTGNIIMNAADNNEVVLHLRDSSTLKHGGKIIRQTSYGALLMTTDAKLVFNGMNSQEIAKTKLPSSGTDSLHYGKVLFENSAGISLAGNMVVSDTLFLTTGNIKTFGDSLIIIEENAVIHGASKNAFIDGPMMKRGGTNNKAFLFPVGSGDTYAPIEISKITVSNLEVTARYDGDPPPFGVFRETEVKNISSNQYWTLSKNIDEPLEITLHWMDTEANGIDKMGDLIVVGLTEDSGAEQWRSYANGGTTGTVGTNSAGSITAGDPPPFGVFKFTIGSTTAVTNPLPVELIQFHAIPQNDIAYLDWQTASEINSSHFIVERSQDGYYYQDLITINSKGNTRTLQEYTVQDRSPYYGYNYYRLKMVDKDGTFEYSPIEIVKIDVAPKFNMFPNPVKDVINLTREFSNNEDQTIEVFDRNGQRLYISNTSFEDGTFQISTNELNLLDAGTYFLRITNGTRSQVLKFLKIY